MVDVNLQHISKSYGDTNVIRDINLDIRDGERLVLLGPSGCGKSTILRMIAGFVPITSGDLLIDGSRVNELAPAKRQVSMVFQNYALYPHMTVKQNITYALKVHKVPADVIERRLAMVADFLELTPYFDRKPAELSGGQQQRVALARATVKSTSVFLLDEPLSNLDAQLRVAARESLMELHNRFKQTMVYVTHDQVEAMTFGTRIVLLRKGDIQMADTPENVYHRPANVFTARFIGSPPANILSGIRFADDRIDLGDGAGFYLFRNWRDLLGPALQGELHLGVRPEHVVVKTEPHPNSMPALVERLDNMGATTGIVLRVGNQHLVASSRFRRVEQGDRVHVSFYNDQLHFFGPDERSLGYPANVLAKKDALGRGEELARLIGADDAAQAREFDEYATSHAVGSSGSDPADRPSIGVPD